MYVHVCVFVMSVYVCVHVRVWLCKWLCAVNALWDAHNVMAGRRPIQLCIHDTDDRPVQLLA